MNFIKRFFRLFRRRNYMIYTKPCPRCGGRRVYFDIDWSLDTDKHFCLVCDDCGFVCQGRSISYLLDRWNAFSAKGGKKMNPMEDNQGDQFVNSDDLSGMVNDIYRNGRIPFLKLVKTRRRSRSLFYLQP